MLKIIIGLGNPGEQYRATRHNAGFWLLDAIAERDGLHFSAKSKLSAEVAAIGNGAYLFKPQTFMNLSGAAAIAAVNFYQADIGEVLVVHDEADLPPGSAKLKQGGGDAGHRGLQDISQRIGSGYWRLRLGIGKPAVGEVADYVLQPPSAEDAPRLDAAIANALQVWDGLLAGDFAAAMQILHTASAAATE